MVNYDGTSVGLRGGRWWYSGDAVVVFRLTRVRFVPGVEVTGTARWPTRGGAGITATLHVRGSDGTTGTLRISWPHEPNAVATLAGTVGGRQLRATMPAP
jgi:hypothetical protein